MDEKIENKIRYWSKHQELDKFNYNFESSSYVGMISVTFAMIMTLLVIITSIKMNYWVTLFFIAVVAIVSFFMLNSMKKDHQKKLKDYNNSFRIREAMLREWYGSCGVDTDLLDKNFEDIKKVYRKGLSSNKQLELIARDVLNK